MKLAVVRGKFLNQYEMQSFEPLMKRYDITAFGSLTSYHDSFPFKTDKLPSPMDLPDFPYKMSVLNRLFVDAHYLLGLEQRLKGFDIVHTAETYYHYTQQCLSAKKKGYVKKVVATVLENIPFNNEGIWGRKAFKKRSRDELDHIIALTQKTKKALLLEGADPDKITVIGHGIDTKRFMPSPAHWKRLGDDKHQLTILFSGRLESYKGIFDVLEAFRILIEDTNVRKAVRLTFCGDGGEKDVLIQKMREYGLETSVQIIRVPYDEMPAIYRNADIFIAPSVSTKTWEEQYCTALLEAQSMGLPIITTRSGGIPENVGDAALYVEENNPVQLAKSLSSLIRSGIKRLSFGKKARKRAEEVHDIRRIAKRFDNVYVNVLG